MKNLNFKNFSLELIINKELVGIEGGGIPPVGPVTSGIGGGSWVEAGRRPPGGPVTSGIGGGSWVESGKIDAIINS